MQRADPRTDHYERALCGVSMHMVTGTGLTTTDEVAPSPLGGPDERVGLVLAGSTEEPERVGEAVLLVPDTPERLLGRGTALDGDRAPRVQWTRQRPGESEARPALRGRYISRQQLLLRPERTGVDVERMGRSPLRINGGVIERGLARPGDTVQVGSHLLFVAVRRPAQLAEARSLARGTMPEFGEADSSGFVGESPAAWRLREQIATLAVTPGHVLVLGDGGTGKELAVRALHMSSNASDRPFVSRSAAALSANLIDAELFGNAEDYPVPGAPARPGLVGEANGGTLFLDDVGALEPGLPVKLLRVLDVEGDYLPVGANTPRRANLRVIATARTPADPLPSELLARFTLQLRVPGLTERIEDIPAIARQVVLTVARRQPALGEQFIAGWNGDHGSPRIAIPLMDRLLRHPYEQHVRELEALLLLSATTSRGDELELTPEVEERMGPEMRGADELTPDEIRRAIERCGGNRERAAKELGLKNRYALFRLMKKHGITAG